MPGTPSAPPATTDELVELTVGPVAHGGHCVARTDGRVVFVRHTLPGEKILARVTETGGDPATARFWRADAVEVLEPSPDRVPGAWPAAGPGGVGGGELAHVSLDGQHRWKEAVLAEQLERLAHLPAADLPAGAVHVEAAPGDTDRGGLHWRTRIDLVVGRDGRAGMHRYRTHDVLALDPAAPTGPMPLATQDVLALADAEGVFTRRWEPGTRLELVAPAAGGPSAPLLLADGLTWRGGRADQRPNARRTVTETVTVRGTTWTHRVAGDGFWQVHREAPALLVGAVLDALGHLDLDGATVLDLYAGAGLFTLPLSDTVDAPGATGRVVSVEGSPRAVKDARRSLHDRPHVELHAGPVDHVLAALRAAAGSTGGLAHADAVVLDPPRVGAGRVVVEQVAHLTPATVVYVACDPAALARDVALFAGHGYDLTALRAFDLFPMTHHLEAVATLTRRS